MTQFDHLSLTSLENIDNFIEYSPYSQYVNIYYPNYSNLTKDNTKTENIRVFGYEEDEAQFGYEDREDSTPTLSKALILYNPTRRFLRKIGISFDSEGGGEGELPIIGLFKTIDNVIKDCKVDIVIYNTENKEIISIDRTLHTIDVLTTGNFNTLKIAYKLAPFRG